MTDQGAPWQPARPAPTGGQYYGPPPGYQPYPPAAVSTGSPAPGPGGWPGYPPGAPEWPQNGPAGAPAGAPRTAPRRRGPLLAGAGIGLVVAAVAVGILLVTGLLGWHPPRTDDRPIALPATVNDLQDYGQAARAAGGSKAESSVQRGERVAQNTLAALQRSHGGAGVGTRVYASPDLGITVIAMAVRSSSPTLEVLPAEDADSLGLAAPTQEIKTVGDVRCLVRNPTTPQGQELDPRQVTVVTCQRTNDTLTVAMAGNFSGVPVDQAAGWTDTVFDAVNGS